MSERASCIDLKIDLVNHIQYAYSHSLLESRLAMTVYTAIKAQ